MRGAEAAGLRNKREDHIKGNKREYNDINGACPRNKRGGAEAAGPRNKRENKRKRIKGREHIREIRENKRIEWASAHRCAGRGGGGGSQE